MKETIGLAEAKARLSELIDRVQSGVTVVISRKGDPVAEVRPARRITPEEAVKRIRAIARRAANRNQGKLPWPARGKTFRNVAHERHRST